MSDNEKVYESFRKNLNNYLMERFHYKRAPIKYVINNTVITNMKQIDLYLRLPSHHAPNAETLIIARIGFYKTRVGNGVSLLKFLISQVSLLGNINIGIEQTNINSANFAKKLGFIQINEKNWIISVDTLKKNLENKYGVEKRN